MSAEANLIVWSDELLTGVKEIDDQHQILVNMLNDANVKLAESSSRAYLDEIVRELISYALYHFDTEEEMMIDKGYDDTAREAHFAEHRAFSEKVSAVQEELKVGKLISREDLLGFLNAWLINHIMKTDKRFGAFVTGQGVVS
jgi:hemerythrin